MATTKNPTPTPQAEPGEPVQAMGRATPQKDVAQPMARDEHTGKAGRYVRDKATGQRRPA